MSDQPGEIDERVTAAMLAIVDPDPVVAVVRFRKLLDDLCRWLEWKGCREPDEVAAESIFRSLKRLDEGVDTAASGLRAYVFGVAGRVLQEGWRADSRARQLEPDDWERYGSSSRDHARAEALLMLQQSQRLVTKEQWDLLVRYSTEDDHTAQCRELGMTPGRLRVEVHRIRKELKAKALPGRERGAPRRFLRRRRRRGPATPE